MGAAEAPERSEWPVVRPQKKRPDTRSSGERSVAKRRTASPCDHQKIFRAAKEKAGHQKRPAFLSLRDEERSLDRFLQFLGGAERDLLGRLDLDGFAGRGIAAHTRTALAHNQNAQTVETNAGAFLQVLGDKADDIFDHRIGALLGEFML